MQIVSAYFLLRTTAAPSAARTPRIGAGDFPGSDGVVPGMSDGTSPGTSVGSSDGSSDGVSVGLSSGFSGVTGVAGLFFVHIILINNFCRISQQQN